MYPIMLQLKDRSCVVVGGGNVAARKVTQLIENGARVTVISPDLHPSLQSLAGDHELAWVARRYAPGMLATYQPVLVFAATDSEEVNRQVGEDARQIGALVNATDDSLDSDFSNMAVLQKSSITVGISTGGESPVMAGLLKMAIDEAISDEFIILTGWLGEVRHMIRQQIDTQAERQQLYERILASDVVDLLRSGQDQAACALFDDIVQARVAI
ncbi:MAG: bifunctional precorrin-2 dehydrogenase/sirohydrochlorin ferrochelatase [Chloroflexi bacterium]|nr:bifunctional precorrin-2 dehydrogenase/sirohydrochlorin ferrochelatase [Chloroflexota bacterium]